MVRSMLVGAGVMALIAALFTWQAFAADKQPAGKAEAFLADLAKIEKKWQERVNEDHPKDKGRGGMTKEELIECNSWHKYVGEVRKSYKDHGYPVPAYVESGEKPKGK